MQTIDRLTAHFPPQGMPLLGENNRVAITNKVYSQGFFRRLRNYHLDIDGATKRQGTRPYQAIGRVYVDGSGSEAVQQLAMWKFSGTQKVVAICNGKFKDGSGGSWSDKTGAVTIASGDNNHLRFCMFHDGTDALLIGTDGTNTPFKWTGTGNISVLGGTPPSSAVAIASFQGRVFALNTNSGPTILEYSDDATADSWSAGQYFHCDRSSEGVALNNHSANCMIVFHRESWHRVEFFFVDTGLASSYFARYPGGTRGPVSPDATVTFRGITYFASDDGIYRITDPMQKEEKISGPIEWFWEQLNDTRRQYIQAFARGRGGDEIVFLVSDIDTSHNDCAIIYNPEMRSYNKNAGWTIFDSAAGAMDFNCGLGFTDSVGRDITLVGDYKGIVQEAWGNDQYTTGYVDDGDGGVEAPVEDVCQTGYMDFGMNDYIKGLRAIQADFIISGDRTFNFAIYGSNLAPSILDSQEAVGGGGDLLDKDFFFDVSYFAETGVSDMELEGIDSSARFFQIDMSGNSVLKPHSLSAMRGLFVPERKAIF